MSPAGYLFPTPHRNSLDWRGSREQVRRVLAVRKRPTCGCRSRPQGFGDLGLEPLDADCRPCLLVKGAGVPGLPTRLAWAVLLPRMAGAVTPVFGAGAGYTWGQTAPRSPHRAMFADCSGLGAPASWACCRLLAKDPTNIVRCGGEQCPHANRRGGRASLWLMRARSTYRIVWWNGWGLFLPCQYAFPVTPARLDCLVQCSPRSVHRMLRFPYTSFDSLSASRETILLLSSYTSSRFDFGA